jgi:hypothetical protein
MSLGFAALPAGASIIAEDAFNYIPLGFSLDTANGGSGWTDPYTLQGVPWSAAQNATVGAGLTTTHYGGLGIGNSATLGNSTTLADMGRVIGAPAAPVSEMWMRMLYSSGAAELESSATAFPFTLTTSSGDGYSIGLTHTLDAPSGAFTLSMTVDGSSLTANFDIGEGTHMLLWNLANVEGVDKLSLWLDPSAIDPGDLVGTAIASVSLNGLNVLGAGGEYFADFHATGYGDMIDELVIGTTFADAIGQLNDPVTSVPEVSGPVMMAMVGLLGGGVVWYRRRHKAAA